jgi:hypothetical protein
MVKDHKHALAFCIVFLMIAISQVPSLILFIFVDTSSNIKLKLTLTLTNKLKNWKIYYLFIYYRVSIYTLLIIYIIDFVQIKHIINENIFLFLIFIYESKDKVIRTKIFCKENYYNYKIILHQNILLKYSWSILYIKTEY